MKPMNLATAGLAAGFLLTGLTTTALAGPGSAFVNVAHLAPFADTVPATEVSVDVDGSEAVPSLFFNQSTGYVELSPAQEGSNGDFSIDVDVIAPPTTGTAVISGTFDLEFGREYTIAAIGNGTLQPLGALFLEDDQEMPLGSTGALLRIVHAAPFASVLADTEVSIRLQDGTVVAGLTNVPYGADSGFLSLPAGTYDLQVATPDGTTTLIDPLPVDLADGDMFTVYAVGDIINQPLGITLQSPDGSFTPLPLAERLPEFQTVPTLGFYGMLLMAILLGFVAIRRLA
ncbi:MAG: DUF4397 domain-containing protein [Pseudomonadota bacterium]